MNENDFLRGIEGEEQQGSDLVAGAEHLVRLKIQSGQQTQPQYQDLELKKEAGDLTESLDVIENCKDCGKEKTACFCPPRMSKEKAASALKEALREKLASSPDWNKTMLAATTGLGAAAGGIGTYLASRPRDSGKSKMEEDLEAQVAANKMKPERGFLHKLKNRETESAHGISQVFREHPVKASLLGLLTGAAGGYSIGQLGGAIARRRGGK